MGENLSSIIRFKRKFKSPRVKRFIKTVNSPLFAKLYMVFGLAVLLATTLLWSILGARLQAGNADQLVNSFLFEHASTFHQAIFPGQHTFLLKWPLFLLIKVFGFSSTAFAVFTVIIVILTLALLLALFYKINRRPLVIGTLCLALASVLLVVPAMPYPGGILPVNMAMITTRNLEYLIYILGLALLASVPRFKSWRFAAAAGTLGLLAASDRLFLTLSIGGALLGLVVYALSRGWNLVSLSVNWLIASLAAGLGAAAVLWLLNISGIVRVVTQAGFGPYGLINNKHGLLAGIKYGILGLLTNFGANPAYDATPYVSTRHLLYSRLTSVGGLSFIINGLLLAGGVFIAWRLIRHSLAHNRDSSIKLDAPSRLSIMLIWSSLVALVVFVLSNHYYPVDARYLTISIFAIFIATAAFARQKTWRPEMVVLMGGVILISIGIGAFTTVGIYNKDKAALTPINDRNQTIAQVLSRHPVNTLAGDYWRVIPTKFISRNNLNVMPLSGCGQARGTLTSMQWQPNLNNVSFAYLLSLDRSLTDYPQCNLQQVVQNYGRPNTSVLIAGSFKQPKELLLFYDHGAHKSSPTTPPPSQGTATVVPIALGSLPFANCLAPTIMNIVAHQDDDLLFMSPDLIHDIKADHCIRTIYVTAGDAGGGSYYWLSREQGSETAYSQMAGLGNIVWIHRVVELSHGQFISIASPKGNFKISLIFMHLPDGGLKGGGFKSSNYESLERLEAGKVSLMQSMDRQSSYTSPQIIDALSDLMHAYLPSEIRTQANFVGKAFPDHSDHMAVGRYVKRAYQQYEAQQYENRLTIPIKFYIGYPARQMPENVSGEDLQEKQAAFFEYAKFDGGVCQSLKSCTNTPTYNAYLHRQYANGF